MKGAVEKRGEPRSLHLVCEPGNGTRYSIVLSEDPHGGILVVWPDASWLGWCDQAGKVWPRAGRRISKVDVAAIEQMIATGWPILSKGNWGAR